MIRSLKLPVLTLALTCVALAGPAWAEPISPLAFRDRLATAIEEATGQSATVVDDRTLKAKSSDGVEFTASIDNVYAAYVAAPERLDELIARFVATLSQRAGAETIDQLVVIVRPSDYVTRSLLAGASLASFVGPHSMAGDLSYFLAVDSPTAVRTAKKDDLARWHVGETQAWQRAVANIKARVGPLQPIRLDGENGASGFGADSGLAPSILADPAMCGPTAPNGVGGQIVLVAGRDFFLFAMPSDPEGLRTFWDAVRDGVSSGRSLSSTPLTCQNGKWAAIAVPVR